MKPSIAHHMPAVCVCGRVCTRAYMLLTYTVLYTVSVVLRSTRATVNREPSAIHFNNQAAQRDKTGITIACDVSDVVIKLIIATIQQIAHLRILEMLTP